MSEQIRIVLVDDHVPYRTGIAAALATEPDLTVVGEGGSAQDALDLVSALHPDLILLDLNMPGNGMTAVAPISHDHQTPVIVLSTAINEDLLLEAQHGGARGYILKGIAARQLAQIIRAVSGGAAYWPTLANYP